MSDELIELYEDEVEKILKIHTLLESKYHFRPNNLATLHELADEVKTRFLEAGLIVNVDITPAMVGVGPPDIAIVGRVDTSGPDHDKLRHQITKRYEQEGRLSHGKLKKKNH